MFLQTYIVKESSTLLRTFTYFHNFTYRDDQLTCCKLYIKFNSCCEVTIQRSVLILVHVLDKVRKHLKVKAKSTLEPRYLFFANTKWLYWPHCNVSLSVVPTRYMFSFEGEVAHVQAVNTMQKTQWLNFKIAQRF